MRFGPKRTTAVPIAAPAAATAPQPNAAYRQVGVVVAPAVAARWSGLPDPPRAELPDDPKKLRHGEVDRYDLVGRLAGILGEDFPARLRAALPRSSGADLLNLCGELETLARKLVHEVEQAETRAQRAAELSERYRREQDTKAAQQAAEEAERSEADRAAAEHLAAVRQALDTAGLVLDPRPNVGRGDQFRIITPDAGHRLLPGEFDAERELVDAFRRGGKSWFVVFGGSAGTSLARVERWLAHHGLTGEGARGES